MSHATESLSAVIRAEIEATGPISFAQFMELALYHPIYGYYQSSTEQIGCQGDFYTSVSVGDLFGRLLAWQFSEWSAALISRRSTPSEADRPTAGLPVELQWVEGGAHDGKLALDILSWVQSQRPEIFPRLEYWIIERSESWRARQAATLAAFSNQVRWFGSWTDLPASGITGIVFSNELLDAFPVYRAGWDAQNQTWFEWGVEWSGSRFSWVRRAEAAPPLREALNEAFWRSLPSDLLSLLPDGFTVDLAPGQVEWWRQAAERLRGGHLLAVDYGLEEHELLAPHRARGTLRAYERHQLRPDPLASPGAQDLTAHINFSAIRRAGEMARMRTALWETQAAFLSRIAAGAHLDMARFGHWGRTENRQLLTLVHPQHLGQSFRVLGQER